MNDQVLKQRSTVLYVIVAANVLVSLAVFAMGVSGGGGARLVYDWSFLPAALTNGILRLNLDLLGHSALTLVTYAFLHAGWMHLLGNMIFLVLAGRRVERELGGGLFLVFYVLTGALGALVHWLTNPMSSDILLGASGAVSGVMGCYLVAAIKGKGGFSPWAIIGALFIVKWLYEQVMSTLAVSTGMVDSPVAYFAHLGGFAMGVYLMLRFYRKPKTDVIA